MQSVPITTNVVNSNTEQARCTRRLTFALGEIKQSYLKHLRVMFKVMEFNVTFNNISVSFRSSDNVKVRQSSVIAFVFFITLDRSLIIDVSCTNSLLMLF
jgi:hypothetical protein